MAGFNGAGVFVRAHDWTADAAAAINIRADRMDEEDDGFATGLSTCITKDGQTTTTERIPFADGISTDTVSELSPGVGVTLDSVLLKDGGVDISGSGLLKGQVKFPATQNASSDANTLDDYEEGTFTPGLSTVGGGSTTYGAQVGRYTKVGNTVSIRLYVRTTNVSGGSGGTIVTGLPFSTVNVSNAYCGGGFYPVGVGSVDNVSWLLAPNDNKLGLRKYTAGTDAVISFSDITNTVEVATQLTYEAQ